MKADRLVANVNKFLGRTTIRISLLVISLLILLAAAIFYGYHSAQIHILNTDQLIDNFLFSDVQSFQGALFPGSHTFLLKWPLFALGGRFSGHEVFTMLTIVVTILTATSMALICYLVSKRNVLIAALSCLLISTTMLLTPVQVAPGRTLPVGIGMITTRNLEFIVMALVAFLMVKTQKIRSWQFWLGAVLLAMLGVSDALFLETTLLATLIFAVLACIRKKGLDRHSFLPLGSAIVGFIFAKIIILVVNSLHITHIISSHQLSIAGSIKQMLIQFLNSIESIFINFGAPIFGLPQSKSLILYLLCALVAILACLAMGLVCRKWWRERPRSANTALNFLFLYILAVFASLAAFIVMSNGATENSRYIQIIWFAGIFALAYVIARVDRRVVSLLIVGFIAISPAVFWLCGINSSNSLAATRTTFSVTQSDAADVLTKERINVLVGNYWWVVPVKVSMPELTVVSIDGCNLSVGINSSLAWVHPTDAPRSAVLLNRNEILSDGSSVYINSCSEEQLQNIYGKPSDRVVLQNDSTGPITIIYIYDYDIREKLLIPKLSLAL